jgi:hypothetical protein
MRISAAGRGYRDAILSNTVFSGGTSGFMLGVARANAVTSSKTPAQMVLRNS